MIPGNKRCMMEKTPRKPTYFDRVVKLIAKGTNPLAAARIFIDGIDKMIIDLLGMRYKIVTGIVAPYKREKGLPAEDPQREKKVIQNVSNRSVYAGLPIEDGVRTYKCIIGASKRSQITSRGRCPKCGIVTDCPDCQVCHGPLVPLLP